MENKLGNILKATIIGLIVALFITATLFLAIYLFLGQDIGTIFSLANTVTINTDAKVEFNTIFNENKNKLENYPEYGTKYAEIKISKINVDLPVYYGDTLEILKNGVGHSSGSYFPGEGGSIVYMGHNSKKIFRGFSELQIGDEIEVNTSYGKFTYKIYDMQLVKETELEKLPIQNEEEILMVYTCYPFNNIGYTTQRYVVYAKLEK